MTLRNLIIAVLLICGLAAQAEAATTWYVTKAGHDTSPGDGSESQPWLTIQKCADVAQAGDTCLVFPGTYAERVTTARNGSSGLRITFQARGHVTMQGFELQHTYITVNGFDITGHATKFQGMFYITSGASYCEITNNVIRDGLPFINAIYFVVGNENAAANNCTIKGNRLSSFSYTFVTLAGDGHAIEDNYFEYQQATDYLRIWGTNLTFRRNVFWRGMELAGGAHPDSLQTFRTATDLPSNTILFEGNWFSDQFAQLCNINAGQSQYASPSAYIYGWTFRNNVLANIKYNANFSLPYILFENNTVYRLAWHRGYPTVYEDRTSMSGFGSGGNYNRTSSHDITYRSNVLLAIGGQAYNPSDTSGAGYYALVSTKLALETLQRAVVSGAEGDAIFANLQANSYIDSEGTPLAAASSVVCVSNFTWTLGSAYDAYKTDTCNLLVTVATANALSFSTFSADYNYVAGSRDASTPYFAKRSVGCVEGATFTAYNFCEAVFGGHGINGGDPKLTNEADLLGPDGIPFTLDDGLKPLTTGAKPLCGTGYTGNDIGAYSCTAGVVWEGGAAVPSAPTGVTVSTGAVPVLQWTQTSGDFTLTKVLIDKEHSYVVGTPTQNGTTYTVAMPNILNGSHTLSIMACNTGGCSASTPITVVKM